MEIVSFAVIVIMAVRCISYGVSAFTDKNIVGGIASVALAIGSVVCGTAVFY
ncbi:MAG: hypothetical protein KIG65_07785 [Eubacteriales bacterium]|nr:hypothetical protein [Eubacteriales bacterium]